MENVLFISMVATLTLIDCSANRSATNPAFSSSFPNVRTAEIVTGTYQSSVTAASGNAPRGHVYWVNPPTMACNLPNSTHLNVTRSAQETQQWCWAAAGQMIMRFFGRNVSQCSQASRQFKTQCQCPKCPEGDFTLSPCNQGAFPAFEDWGFDAYASTVPLSLEQIKAELACRKSPIAFSWITLDSRTSARPSGHTMVAVGYSADFIEVIDPLPDCFFDDGKEYSTFQRYDYYVNSAMPEKLAHWQDRYAVSPALN